MNLVMEYDSISGVEWGEAFIFTCYDGAPLRSPALEKGVRLGVALAAIMILDFEYLIHTYLEYENTYACIIQVVSDMLFSGSSY